jgi:hypothetical protein
VFWVTEVVELEVCRVDDVVMALELVETEDVDREDELTEDIDEEVVVSTEL